MDADLQDANLQDANLYGALLYIANLQGADLPISLFSPSGMNPTLLLWALGLSKKQYEILKCYEIKGDPLGKAIINIAIQDQGFGSIVDFKNNKPKGPTVNQLDAIMKQIKDICDF